MFNYDSQRRFHHLSAAAFVLLLLTSLAVVTAEWLEHPAGAPSCNTDVITFISVFPPHGHMTAVSRGGSNRAQTSLTNPRMSHGECSPRSSMLTDDYGFLVDSLWPVADLKRLRCHAFLHTCEPCCSLFHKVSAAREDEPDRGVFQMNPSRWYKLLSSF